MGLGKGKGMAMNLKIISMQLQNFKGCADAVYVFDGKNTIVTGCNGAGKTTIATAFYWVFCDKDYDLHSNPNVMPIGNNSATPKVEMVLDINGEEVIVSRTQIKGVNITNTYSVNGIPIGEKAFKKKLLEYGIHYEDILLMSHPNVFTGQKTADMRDYLFGMVSEISDVDIVAEMQDVKDIAELLEKYSSEEIKSMHNTILRNINSEYGKNGEILRAKVEGINMLAERLKQFKGIKAELDNLLVEMREIQRNYEQEKANAEKILYQLELVNRMKNDLLTSEINKNFDMVNWQMFDYQKNGEVKDCCIPLIDGKCFGESTNTGREVFAKLDIIKGLQRFYEQGFPIFLDGAECLSRDTKNRIDMDCQLIMLNVGKNKKLKIDID